MLNEFLKQKILKKAKVRRWFLGISASCLLVL